MTAVSETSALPEATATQLLINGTWRAASDGGTFPDLNPATSRPLTDIASATAADVDAAVTAARGQLSGEWAAMPGVERGKILNRVADLIERDADLLARLEALDVGKPIGQPGLLDVPNAAGTFRHFAGWADKITGQTIPTAGYFGQPTHSYTVREPVGVIGAIVPWNTPLMICAWKLGPALAAGNAVVVKPPEDAPLSILHLGKLLTEAGLPDGVVSIVPGLGHVTGQAIVDHPGVDKISFTGSPRVGRLIAKSAAETFKRVTLELGGKSPQIILDDADVEAAINGTALGLFFNQGEVCAAGTRVLVHRSLYDQVVDGLSAAADAQVLGDPLDPATTMGAIVSRAQLARVSEYIASAHAEGARLLYGGRAPDDPALRDGNFLLPTVFYDVRQDMRIAREEIFGPLLAILPWRDSAKLMEDVNAVDYGLTCSIWSRDINTALRTAQRVQAGYVWINEVGKHFLGAPFGGVRQSGIGREECLEELLAFTREKNIHVALPKG